MMIRVVNKKTYNGDGEYIGRPSILGNPFSIGRDGSREEVVSKYMNWLAYNIRSNRDVKEEILRLKRIADNGDLTLICWCSPLSCHGDMIKIKIEELQNVKKTTK